jgi:hypothetical protein
VIWECTLRRKYPGAAISRLFRLLKQAGIRQPAVRV